jgi:hypothetical protein
MKIELPSSIIWIIDLWSHPVILSVSTSWLWYWKLSVSVMSDNELALILKIISQCDVRQRAGSDTENDQSVWCQTTSWLWYWKLSVSVMSDNELALILKTISQCDVRQRAGSDTENYQSSVMSDNELALILKIISQVWCQTMSWLWYWKLSVSVMSKTLWCNQ